MSKGKKNQQVETQKQAFSGALRELENEKGIPENYLLEKIHNAIAIAIRRDYGNLPDENILINIGNGSFDVAIRKTVVDSVENPETEIDLVDALKYNMSAHTGGFVDIPLETREFGRIAAQTAKHVIKQGIREAERGQMLAEFQSREHELVSAVVTRLDPVRGSATVEIGHTEATLQRSEMIPGKILREGMMIKVYVVEVAETERGPRLVISRTHPGLVKRLFEMEVPEIYDGTVEVKAISREAGSRSKLAVWSKDPNVDPIGACIGPKGARIAKIVEELDGEKIDVVRYSDSPEEFIAAALSPADVVSVTVAGDGVRSCTAIVPDSQLSLAIGNKGQNARLAAKLTGWKIDIKPETY